jgi:hypothetical protein
MCRHELSDEECAIIAHFLQNTSRGIERVATRRIINGTLWRFRTGSSRVMCRSVVARARRFTIGSPAGAKQVYGTFFRRRLRGGTMAAS